MILFELFRELDFDRKFVADNQIHLVGSFAPITQFGEGAGVRKITSDLAHDELLKTDADIAMGFEQMKPFAQKVRNAAVKPVQLLPGDSFAAHPMVVWFEGEGKERVLQNLDVVLDRAHRNTGIACDGSVIELLGIAECRDLQKPDKSFVVPDQGFGFDFLRKVCSYIGLEILKRFIGLIDSRKAAEVQISDQVEIRNLRESEGKQVNLTGSASEQVCAVSLEFADSELVDTYLRFTTGSA